MSFALDPLTLAALALLGFGIATTAAAFTGVLIAQAIIRRLPLRWQLVLDTRGDWR